MATKTPVELIMLVIWDCEELLHHNAITSMMVCSEHSGLLLLPTNICGLTLNGACWCSFFCLFAESEEQLLAGAAETQRAVRLRATRQDALQLATAVVRLEKEKAALQSQASLLQTRVGLHSAELSMVNNLVQCDSLTGFR